MNCAFIGQGFCGCLFCGIRKLLLYLHLFEFIMADHNELGRWGEEVARDYLLTQGYAIGGENIRIAGVEIDFIAMRDDAICFVEVKTRATDFTDPADAIDNRKRSRLVRAADTYINSYDIPLEPRFDLVLVIGNPMNYTIEHIPDAFLPTLNNR